MRPTIKLSPGAISAPGVAAVAVRPSHAGPQPLVVCRFGICPLQYKDGQYTRLEAPLQLGNVHRSHFDVSRVHDAAYDAHSGLLVLAHGSRIYGVSPTNQVSLLAGDCAGGDDDGGGGMVDGPASAARFASAQRVAADGRGSVFVRDRDASSRNGFRLRALQEASLPGEGGGSGLRAVSTVQLAGDLGPAALAFDPRRGALLLATRGLALHQLLPHGITAELAGTDEPQTAEEAARAAAAACAGARSVRRRFDNVQAIAADPDSGNVYVLDGTSGCRTALKVLGPDGSVRTLAEELRIGPSGSSRWPRLAVLPYGHLAVYGISEYDMMLLKL